MRGRKLTQRDVDEIWRLYEKGRSCREISRSTEIGRSTIARYIQNGFRSPVESRYVPKKKVNEDDTNCWVPTPEEIEERVKPFRRFRDLGLTGERLSRASNEYILANGTEIAKRRIKRERKTNSRKFGN